MSRKKQLNQIRLRRKNRTRVKLFGTAQKPRLSVFRSNKQICVQLIDDEVGKTLVSASTAEVKKHDKSAKNSKVKAAEELGKLIAEKALRAGIKQAIFDRGDKKFHGRVKAVAEGVRSAGLKV